MIVPYSKEIGPITDILYRSTVYKGDANVIDWMLQKIELAEGQGKFQLGISNERKHAFVASAESMAKRLKLSKSDQVLIINGRV